MNLRRAEVLEGGLLLLALMGLVAGLSLHVMGRPQAATLAWTVGVLPVLAALFLEIVLSLRRGEVGLDVVAALSMSAALVFGETLAAAVVAVMYAGGTVLEAFADARARREMTDLLGRTPRVAMRYGAGGLEEVAIDRVCPGDRLLVRQGEIVGVDGVVASETAFVDTSALTGEPLPVRLHRGEDALSGSTNAGEAFDLTATRSAGDSTYAGIVRLVEAAQRSKAPMSRLADRWSLGFLAATLVLAGAAWTLTGDPIRAVAVLVVATPCPLILAVPVALVAGLSRATHFGILIKGAPALEAMAAIRTLVLDKTGTLTEGRPEIFEIEDFGGLGEAGILRFGAALDQASKHPVAQAIVAAARERGLDLPPPADGGETAGVGVEGTVEGRRVAIGSERFVGAATGAPPQPSTRAAGVLSVDVAIDGRLAGRLLMADPLRAEAGALVAGLRGHGIDRIVLATGDRDDVARRVTEGLGFDGLHAGLTPDRKVEVVREERAHGPVMMVGDGVNDAPALAAADVGVAMGARGAAASAEAADVVLLVDRLDRLQAGLEVARGARRIAVQSVAVGIGLSLLGMVAAALGWLPPVRGALLQEAIDVAVILNALRALGITPDPQRPPSPRHHAPGHLPAVRGRSRRDMTGVRAPVGRRWPETSGGRAGAPRKRAGSAPEPRRAGR